MILSFAIAALTGSAPMIATLLFDGRSVAKALLQAGPSRSRRTCPESCPATTDSVIRSCYATPADHGQKDAAHQGAAQGVFAGLELRGANPGGAATAYGSAESHSVTMPGRRKESGPPSLPHPEKERSAGVRAGWSLDPRPRQRGQAAGATDVVGVADAVEHGDPAKADYRILSVKFGSTFSVNSSQWRIILGSGINWV